MNGSHEFDVLCEVCEERPATVIVRFKDYNPVYDKDGNTRWVREPMNGFCDFCGEVIIDFSDRLKHDRDTRERRLRLNEIRIRKR